MADMWVDEYGNIHRSSSSNRNQQSQTPQQTPRSQQGRGCGRFFFWILVIGVAFFIFKNKFGDFPVGSQNESSQSNADIPRPEPGYRRTVTVDDVECAFRWIPAGEFDMGSPESEKGREDDEQLHHVTLTSGFWMLETEVTQELYEKIMEKNPSTFKGENHPVENVSYNNALKFCEKLTNFLPDGVKATLPTEAQWEYACRAGTKTAFWYGDDADSSKMNYDKDMPIRVMSYPENPWGLYDMHGNVWEWTLDSYEVYSSEPVVDPVDLQENRRRNRVPRGGCWGRTAADCRSASRGGNDPYYESSRIGFRIVLIAGAPL